ncbi:MAG TPA: DUF2905 domain-containing protein [Firmicutes bacterium]|nr:DUF2905 domain-containing protein [Bacillota bacterium]HOQ25046.1 DUF2905 domain-containing protein [Bacillota bacterium]HPT68350.1 DUF2905 domain-containing protein [Bacillota bacterium]
MAGLGRTLIVLGLVLTALGGLLLLGSRLPGLGRLPGDIIIQKENFTLYIPITTSILLSVLLSLVLWLLGRR